MTKKINVLLMSTVTILLSSMLMVTGSYALFSDEVMVSNHLQAGKLEATLTRAAVKAHKVDLDTSSATCGKLIDQTITKDVRLNGTNSADVNGFGFDGGETIVPGVYSEATFVIENKGNVAFGYYVEIKGFEGDNTFAGMIEVSVMTGREVEFVDNDKGYELVANSPAFTPDKDGSGNDKKITLSGLTGTNVISLGSKDAFLGEVSLANSTQAFTVKVAFLDADNNNDAEGDTAKFDIVVYAVQLT